jgi:hypothetical protein
MSAAVEGTQSQPNGVPSNGALPSSLVAQPGGAPPPEAAQPEATPPATPEAPKDRFADRFAQLARKERAVLEKQQATQRHLAEREAQLKASAAAFEQERTRYRDMTARLEEAKTNPKAFLRSVYGDDYYDHITKIQLAEDGPLPPEMQVQAIREELAERTEELRRGQADLQAKIESERKASISAERARLAAEAAEEVERFEAEAIDFVKQNAAKYELTTLYERQDLVPLVIRETYEQSRKNGKPRLLSPEEAAIEVEQYLGEELAKAERLRQQKAQAEAAKTQPAPGARPPAPTLTNAMGASPVTPTIPKTGDIREDALRRAAAKFDEVASRRSR